MGIRSLVATWFGILQRKDLELVDFLLISSKYPPEETQEKEEKDDKRDHRPDGDVVNILKNVLVHDRMCLTFRFNLMLF